MRLLSSNQKHDLVSAGIKLASNNECFRLNNEEMYSAADFNRPWVHISVILKGDFEKEYERFTSTIASTHFWGIYYWNPKAFLI